MAVRRLQQGRLVSAPPPPAVVAIHLSAGGGAEESDGSSSTASEFGSFLRPLPSSEGSAHSSSLGASTIASVVLAIALCLAALARRLILARRKPQRSSQWKTTSNRLKWAVKQAGVVPVPRAAKAARAPTRAGPAVELPPASAWDDDDDDAESPGRRAREVAKMRAEQRVRAAEAVAGGRRLQVDR